MADLQSCFFCGTPEELTQYAVIPARYTDDGNPQTAVLCPQCKTKLLQVVEPLVERLEGSASESAAPATSDDGITMTSQAGSEPPEPEPAGDETAEPTTAAEDAEEPEPSPDTATEVPGSGGADAPPSYRRAMRMLETRPFPLERSEVESLLANAYDLETHELEAVLGHAVETGDLVEEDGQFRKPE